VRGEWAGPPDEKPAVTGAKFLQTLDSLSGIDRLFSGWQLYRNWQIAEDDQPRLIPLARAFNSIAEIVECGVALDDFDEPRPGDGYTVCSTAGTRGSRSVTFTVRTGNQFFDLSFGERGIASDLSIVTYPLFKAALLAIVLAWEPKWAYAHACRNDVVKVPIDFGPGVPAFRIDSALPVPLDPTFPKSVLHVPWIIYLSAKRADGVTLARELLTERTPDGGLLASATTERLDPTNPEHVRRARILVETMIACTGYSSK
jgi:Immunity protein 52